MKVKINGTYFILTDDEPLKNEDDAFENKLNSSKLQKELVIDQKYNFTVKGRGEKYRNIISANEAE